MPVLYASKALAFSDDSLKQPLHVSNCEGSPRFCAYHARNVIGNYHTIEIYFFKCFQYFIYVTVAIIQKGFHKMWQRLRNITQMYFEDFFPFTKIFNRLNNYRT